MASSYPFLTIGSFVDLPTRHRSEIGRLFPGLPIGGVANEFGHYITSRDADQPTPKEARQALSKICRTIAKLQKLIDPADKSFQAVYPFLCEALRGSWMNPDLLHALTKGDIVLAEVSLIPLGRRLNPRALLVSQLAKILRATGRTIDARPKGDLCQLLGIVLEAAGEAPSDVRRIVEPVIRRMEI